MQDSNHHLKLKSVRYFQGMLRVRWTPVSLVMFSFLNQKFVETLEYLAFQKQDDLHEEMM